MSNKNKEPKASRWGKRAFFGGSKELADEMEKKGSVEEIVSPVRQIVRNYRERKLAMVALFVVIAMFALVFIGPLFIDNYTDVYKESLMQNMPPTLSLMSVPGELEDDIKMIDSYSNFSVGLSNAGKVYVWGATSLGTTGKDMEDIPEEILNDKIAYVAAGYDHAIAISEEGKVYAWGANKLGQYGYFDPEEYPNIVSMPDELLNGTIDVANIKKVTCGYQCSAILMNDGTLYIWGNKNTYANIDKFVGKDDLVDIDFTLNYIIGVGKLRNGLYVGQRGLYDKFHATFSDKAVDAADFLDGRKIESIAATCDNICMLLDDGSLAYTGNFASGLKETPVLADDEDFVTLGAGARHYTALTNKGNVYSWGANVLGQADVSKDAQGATNVFVGSFQSYAVDENDDLQASWGYKGAIFGTDKYGANILHRIIHGGKMTMTIGAVAVIISTIIGVLVGCISGYFGGKVDMILMRVTEIFAAIPFLPFALILSAVMAQMDISENAKIFLLMCILGVLTWTGLARMVRGQVLAARENEYVTAAKAIGVKESRIAFRHILPNIVSIIFVTLTLDFATCMLTESSLSYLGFGVNYPRPTWGNMLNGANNSTIITHFWWQWVFPSLFLAITCICINIVGDTLRDVMDPKSDRDK